MTSLTCRTALIQLNTTNDMAANLREVERLTSQAGGEGAEFMALPENAFQMRAADTEEPLLYAPEEHPGVQLCQQQAIKYKSWILIGSIFSPCGKVQTASRKWYNRSVLINSVGKIVQTYDKIHLFDAQVASDRVYRESDRIQAGDQVTVADTDWGRIGLAICYDVRFPHLFRDLAKAGSQFIAVPAAFTYVTGEAHWHVLLRARAIETGAYIIAPGQCGNHPGGRRTYGHSLIVDPWGKIIVEASEEKPEVVMATLDMTRVGETRRALPSLQHDRSYLPPPDYVI